MMLSSVLRSIDFIPSSLEKVAACIFGEQIPDMLGDAPYAVVCPSALQSQPKPNRRLSCCSVYQQGGRDNFKRYLPRGNPA